MWKALTMGLVLAVGGVAACRDDARSAAPASKPVAGEDEHRDKRASNDLSDAEMKGKQGDKKGMRGDMEGMHGDMKGMHGDMKGMHGMGSGDMAGMTKGMCAHMMVGVQTSVENTADGAIIRMTAANADGIAKVQHMATMMRDCMSPKHDGDAKP